MRKITFIQLAAIVLAMLNFLPANSQDLLLKYDFNGGVSTPSYIADGVVSSGLGRKGVNAGLNYSLSTKEDRECLAITTTLGIVASDYVYVPIGAAEGKMVQVTKTVITHRKATGNTKTGNARSYLYTALDAGSSSQNLIYWGPPNFGGYPLGNNTSWKNNEEFMTKNGSGVNTPFNISTSTTQYAAFGFAAASGGPGEWWIDEVAYYGTVFTEGEIAIASSNEFGDNNVINVPVVNNLSLTGLISDDVTVTVEGQDAAMFSLTKSTYTAAEVNAGTTLAVTYTPTTVNVHTGQLKLSYGTKENYVDLKGAVAIVNETFDTGDMTGLSDGSPLTTLEGYTVLSGWTTDNVSKWHYPNTTYGFSPVLEPSVGVVSKYSTPEVDLSKPYKITLVGKKQASYGRSYIFANQDTIRYFNFTSDSYALNTIDGFVGTANTKITFQAVGIDGNKVIFDNIVIANTTSPSVSLPLTGRQDFGNILPNTSKTIGIPIKAYNLTGDLTVSVPSTGEFELLSGTTISKVDAEAGTEISVKFTPVDYENYGDMIQVTGGGLPTGGSTRTIYLTGVGSISTDMTNLMNDNKLFVEHKTLNISTSGAATMQVYSVNGVLLQQKSFVNSTQTILAGGLYLVRVKTEQGNSIEKIIVK